MDTPVNGQAAAMGASETTRMPTRLTPDDLAAAARTSPKKNRPLPGPGLPPGACSCGAAQGRPAATA